MKSATLLSNLTRDASFAPVQTGGSIATQDGTDTPITSPYSFTTDVSTITVPDNAIEFIVNPSVALRISDLLAMTRYDVVAAASKESIPCSKMNKIYIRGDSGAGTLNFRFTIL